MSKVLVTESNLQDIADAIREKLEVQTTYRPGDMAAAIESISGGYPEPTGTINITQNGTVNVKDYASADVNVSGGGGGTTVIHGSGEPTSNIGSDGNIYFQTGDITYVEYLENDSAGNPYINTGFKPTGKTKVEMVVSNSESIATWFGMWNNAYNSGAFAFSNDRTGLFVGYANNGGTSGSLVDSNQHTVILDKGTASVDGTTVRSYTQADSFQALYPLYLYTQNRKGSPSTGYTTNRKFRLHSCKIYDDGVLVVDLAPVVINQIPALYDKITGSIHYNAGIGSFTAGAQQQVAASVIINGYLKVGGAWQALIGSDINDVGG